jgi:hypothetical protein
LKGGDVVNVVNGFVDAGGGSHHEQERLPLRMATVRSVETIRLTQLRV